MRSQAASLIAVSLVAGTVLGALIGVPFLYSQTVLIGNDYFPADMEFQELQEVQLDKVVETPALLSDIEVPIFDEAGFQKQARRIYRLAGGGSLTIDVVALKDKRGAYSLLTLLRKSSFSSGPPGDGFSVDESTVIFAQRNFWVRIQANSADLAKRVATSVSNRIGRRDAVPPSLISHLPDGYDSSSVHYFLGPRSLSLYGSAVAANALKLQSEVEIAQARYATENQTGTLSLISFPTGQMAEDSLELLSESAGSGSKGGMYAKRAGPLLGILEGSFDPPLAEKTLAPLQYTYAIKWIFDKNNRPAIVWGIPMGVLGTVVRSMVMTMLFCALSVVAGIGLGFARFYSRDHAPLGADRMELIRLRLDEKPLYEASLSPTDKPHRSVRIDS